METLLYGKGFSTVVTQWGLQHEEEAIAAYVDFLKRNGQHVIEITASGLVVDPDDYCLACSPDGLVRLPGMPDSLGILEIKCPHTLAKDAISPLEASKTIKTFCCKVSLNDEVQLKRSHDYWYQVQGILAITRPSWCHFVIWSPAGISVEKIAFDSAFEEETKANLIRFYNSAVLHKLVLPRHKNGQPICEPFFSGDDLTLIS